MEYKVFIFSNDVVNGQGSFDYDKFNKICAYNLINIKEFNIKKFDIERHFIEDNENLLIFCNNANLDNFMIKNINSLGNKKTFIEEQIVVFYKGENKIVFVPLESDLELLNKVFARNENKKYCEYHLFGLGKSQIEEKLHKLQSEIDGFEYKFLYNNLLSDIYVAYNGNLILIDDSQVKIASEFKQYVYSENETILTEIVGKMLKLRSKTLAICENITKGMIVYSMFKDNENFNESLKTFSFDNFEYLANDELYNKAVSFLKSSQADIAVMTNGRFLNDGIEFNFALADSKEVHIFKNTFKSDKNTCLEMATNSLLFHLAKKLRQNDFTF